MSAPVVRVSRSGEVFVTNSAGIERRVGYADRYDRNGRPSSKWRGVHEGGTRHVGFRTQREAVIWLTRLSAVAL